jgi:hypothetical protein
MKEDEGIDRRASLGAPYARAVNTPQSPSTSPVIFKTARSMLNKWFDFTEQFRDFLENIVNHIFHRKTKCSLAS